MGQKNYSKTEVRKPNPFLLWFFYIGLRIYAFISGVKIKTKACCKIKAPAVVLCNHGSFFDFLYAHILIKKERANFVTARLYFYNRLLGGLLRRFGCFPKSMFATDLESIKNCIKVTAEGGVLAMMPEARLSTVGEFEDIQENTYSFLKKTAANIYTINISGDYLAKPKWAKCFRRGSLVEAELNILLTAEELEGLSLEEIKEKTEKRLYYNEFEWLKNNPQVKYRCKKIAEGLENILNYCPKCKKKHSLKTKGNVIYCENCGRLTSMDNRYRFEKGFEFENLQEWYNCQTELMKREIENNENYILQAEVELQIPSQTGRGFTTHGGYGVCTLNKEGLKYTGSKNGEEYTAQFPLKKAYRLLFGAGENFEIYNGSEILYFVPKDTRTAVDWYIASKILYNKYI